MRAARVVLLLGVLMSPAVLELSIASDRATSGGTASSGSPPTLQWVRTGGPLGGLGYDVRMRPDNPDVMYVTDAWSGVHVSTDGGKTWAPANTGITTRTGPSGDAIPVFSLTIDPSDPDVIWCGTQNKRGIWKSMDAGSTWAEKDKGVVEDEGISFRGFCVDPTDSRIVYAAAEISSYAWRSDREARLGRQFDLVKGAVYKTTDGGEHWTAIWRGDNLARYVLLDPRNSNVLYVSTGIFDREAANADPVKKRPGGVGILKSEDGGRTWRVLGEARGLRNLYIGSLFMHPQNPDILLAGVGNNGYDEARSGKFGVYLSSDGGESWTQTLSTRDGPITSVEFSSADPSIAYAGSDSRVFRSRDGGRSWERMCGGEPSFRWGPDGVRAWHPIDFQVDPRDPKRLFANNYTGGLFLTVDGGATWSSASYGYTGAQLQDITLDASAPQLPYVIGRSGPYKGLSRGDDWEGLFTTTLDLAEWYSIALDPADPLVVLASDQFQGVVLRSSDAGRSWSLVFRHPQVDENEFLKRHGFKTFCFAAPGSGIVYGGMCREMRNLDEGRADPSFGVWKSADSGRTWQEANDAHTSGQNVNALAVAPTDPQIVYAATARGGVFRSEDGGQTWIAVNKGLRVLDVRAVAIDPASPATAYVGTEGGGVCKSTNAGASWQASSTGMDSQACVRDIAVDPKSPQTLYAADIRAGVYRSTDGAKTWVKINGGLESAGVVYGVVDREGS
ncbi:MAG: hypothetical protein PHU43_04115 [Candidatus Bipolaricaulis sp.]|nr:hypothetical protein [Candidatus Bipolaricaulis sp.]